MGTKINLSDRVRLREYKKELEKLIDSQNHYITTALQPLNNKFTPMKKEDAEKILKNIEKSTGQILKDGFILHVGGNQWYKNRKGVCKIFC